MADIVANFSGNLRIGGKRVGKNYETFIRGICLIWLWALLVVELVLTIRSNYHFSCLRWLVVIGACALLRMLDVQILYS